MKAILMLNEMPKSCIECKFLITHFAEDRPYMTSCLARTEEDEKKDKWCPLIEINDNIAKLIEVAR